MSEEDRKDDKANVSDVRSDTLVSRPTLRPDTAQDAPLAERRQHVFQSPWEETCYNKIAGGNLLYAIAVANRTVKYLRGQYMEKESAVIMNLIDRLEDAAAVANADDYIAREEANRMLSNEVYGQPKPE